MRSRIRLSIAVSMRSGGEDSGQHTTNAFTSPVGGIELMGDAENE
jgi:hypothetical protein